MGFTLWILIWNLWGYQVTHVYMFAHLTAPWLRITCLQHSSKMKLSSHIHPTLNNCGLCTITAQGIHLPIDIKIEANRFLRKYFCLVENVLRFLAQILEYYWYLTYHFALENYFYLLSTRTTTLLGLMSERLQFGLCISQQSVGNWFLDQWYCNYWDYNQTPRCITAKYLNLSEYINCFSANTCYHDAKNAFVWVYKRPLCLLKIPSMLQTTVHSAQGGKDLARKSNFFWITSKLI